MLRKILNLGKTLIFAYLLLVIAIFLPACKKSSDGIGNQSPPVISSISPTSGPVNTVVTITGSGFSATATDNAVKFNGVTAVVQTATATSIQTSVPATASTGVVTVTVNGQTATGPAFTVTSVVTVTVSTFAGNGTAGFADGAATSAEFHTPDGVAVDVQGNVYIADTYNNRIRKITASGTVSTLAGNGTGGFADGAGTSAEFAYPGGVAVDAQGNVYVADYNNNRIRKITSSGTVSTLAGNGTPGYVDGVGTSAEFYLPIGVAVDAQGNIYVTDNNNHRIRKITSSGTVSTLAGNGTPGFADGVGTSAAFHSPTGVAVDAQGNVYVGDYVNHRIRKITASGTVSTFAGNGTPDYVDGTGTSAGFNYPFGIVLDAQGNIYVADAGNNRIRKITPSGIVSTLAGNGAGYADGAAASALFSSPSGVAVDALGNVYVADTGNNRIRKITIQ